MYEASRVENGPNYLFLFCWWIQVICSFHGCCGPFCATYKLLVCEIQWDSRLKVHQCVFWQSLLNYLVKACNSLLCRNVFAEEFNKIHVFCLWWSEPAGYEGGWYNCLLLHEEVGVFCRWPYCLLLLCTVFSSPLYFFVMKVRGKKRYDRTPKRLGFKFWRNSFESGSVTFLWIPQRCFGNVF